MSGVKHDQDKPMVGLIPPVAAQEEGYVWGMGAKKYGYHNWRKGLTILRICGAILRHTFAIMRGEDIDPESGRHHGAHIRCDAGMLIEFYYEGRVDLDDRYKKEKSVEYYHDGVVKNKTTEQKLEFNSNNSITLPNGATGGGIDKNGSFITYPDGVKVYYEIILVKNEKVSG